MTENPTRIDVRAIAPRDRHRQIFSTFGSLAAGQALELVNDHDPMPLYQRFVADFPGQFTCDYIERGPASWRVAITRTADAPARGSCCGACGGA